MEKENSRKKERKIIRARLLLKENGSRKKAKMIRTRL